MKLLSAPFLSVSATLPAHTLLAIALLSLALPFTAASANPPPSTDTDADAGTGTDIAANAVQVESFSPEGYVKQVRQVTVRFSAAMVALGDPRLDDPFTLDCPTGGHVSGKGRWADTTNWVFDFDADLDAGVRCRFSLKPGLASASGIAVSGRSEFSFHTGGPAILASLPHEGWTDLDEEQVFLLRLDAVATAESIDAHAYCAIDGIVERIPVQVLTGHERQSILDQRRALGYDYMELLWKSGARSDLRIRNRSMEHRDELLTVLRCQRRLPPSTKVLLHWGAGISTTSGIETQADQQLAFRVRPAFTAQVECTRTNARAGCVPVLPIEVNFSAPVPRARALAIRLKSANGQVWAPIASDSAYVPARVAPLARPPTPVQVPTLSAVSFSGPFPENTTLTVLLPAGVVDDAGRPLENAARFPLAVRVDAYPPLVKFSGNFGILEAREGGILPVTLRNVAPVVDPSLSRHSASQPATLPAKMLRVDNDPKSIASWLMRVDHAQSPSGEWSQPDAAAPALWRETTGAQSVFSAADATVAFPLTKPSGAKPEEVIGIPLQRPGFYVVEVASNMLGTALLGPGQTRYVATAALVTDMAVHFKWGRESSLAWVTRLSDGATVADAEVSVSDFCSGVELWRGRTDHDGVAAIAQSLGEPKGYGDCRWQPPLLVVASKGDDFSFTQSNWDQGILPYEFGLPVGSVLSTGIYHSVLDRALFRAGETVSMKHFVRRHVSSGIDVPAGSAGSHQILIVHQGSGQHYSFSASFDAGGVATSTWKIPDEATLGTYSVSIDSQPSAQFKVEQFRLPSMRASVTGPARPQVAPQQLDLDLHVAYMSGGGAGGLPVKLRTLIEPQPQHFDDYPDYQFGGAPVKEGVNRAANGAADVDFDLDADADADAETGAAADTGNGAGAPQQATRTRSMRTQTMPITLDADGSARVTLRHLPALDSPARLTAELEYADANGETLTTTGYVRLAPAALSVGIRPESWVGSPGQLRFRVVAVDLDGKPQAGQALVVSLYQSTAYSYRKRLIGGFYSYETTRETRKLKPRCSGTTNAQGLLLCELAPGASGQIIVRAETRDRHGVATGATTTMWVIDRAAWWFGGTSGDRMDLLPEKKEYQAGETARFQVRMPFREATALVTVEREGVLSSFVTRLHGNAPIVEVPIAPGYAPNAFVSVLAIRGRVAHAAGDGAAKGAGTGSAASRPTPREEVTALVDLTRPAYRLGSTQIKVGWAPFRLDVQVQPEHAVYKIREQASVNIHVTAADGRALPAGTEVALAAVDEALLDLAPNGSWDLLAAMMGQRGLEVWTSTGQMQVVGKRHYGRKAVPHGGGGGRELDRARELFDSLLYWQPRIALDAQGNAHAKIPLNDSLSSFRIVAVAQGAADRFGSGSATINTTQDLILLSGLPPLVREADQYAATFTLRNTTDHLITAQVQVASAALGGSTSLGSHAPNGGATTINAGPAPNGSATTRDVQIPAGQSRDLVWPAIAPIGASRIDWQVTARDVNGAARDHLKVSQLLIPAFPVRTYQATISQLTAPVSMPVRRPAGAIEGRGGLEVTLQATLGGSLDGVREYMSRYPYICLEQLASRAVALRSRGDWDALMQRLPAYMDADGLLKYFPTDWLQGDDSLSAYILAIADEAGWPLVADDQARLLQALTRFVEGRLQRDSALPTADLSIRKLQAIDALSRYHASQASMLDSLTVEPNLLPTSALLDWIGVLERTPGIAHSDDKIHSALGILRARLNFQGTTMGFSTERSDALWWLMISTDSNANRMLLAVLDRPDWRVDVPRLVRGALGRQQFGHWNTTVANAWGVLAMEKFSAAFESTPVSGNTAIRYGADQRHIAWPLAADASQTDLPWQSGDGTLQLAHAGSGAPWAMVRATAALPLDQPLSTGFKIERRISAVEQRQDGAWSRGDVIRVHLALDAQSDMSWVVVDDPIPAGASILGSGLGGQSALMQRADRASGWAWLAFEERRFDAFRAYYRFVPKGHWTVEYTVRLNNPGTFIQPATRVEAMYAPEMLGELPNAAVTIQPTGVGPTSSQPAAIPPVAVPR